MCLWWVFMYPWGHTAVIRTGSHLTKMLFITEGLSLYGGIIFASWCVTPLSSTKMEKKLGEIFRTINVLILPNLILVTFYLPFLSFFLVSGCSTKFVIFCGCGLVCGGDWLGKYRSIKETLKCFLNIVTKRCYSRGSRFFWTCQATIVAVQAAGKLHLKDRYKALALLSANCHWLVWRRHRVLALLSFTRCPPSLRGVTHTVRDGLSRVQMSLPLRF